MAGAFASLWSGPQDPIDARTERPCATRAKKPPTLRSPTPSAIGTVRHIRASFGFAATVNPKSRLFDPAMAGGGILDVGGYPVSAARLIAGAAIGAPFAEPVSVRVKPSMANEAARPPPRSSLPLKPK